MTIEVTTKVEDDDGSSDVTTALILIREKEGKKRGIIGQVKCPRCHGILHYSIASSNGHVWGSCETEDCLHWIQ